MDLQGFSANSELGQSLLQAVKDRVSSYGLDEDVNDVAQYVVMMVENQKSVPDITAEMSGLFGNSFTDEFSQWVYDTLHQLANPQAANSMDFQAQSSAANDDDAMMEDDAEEVRTKLSTSLRDRLGKRTNLKDRVGKGKSDRASGPRRQMRFNTDNIDAIQDEAVKDMGGDPERVRTPKTRCRHWPHCTYPNCKFAHPTKPCYNYPNCTREPGTCPFLHPDDPDPTKMAPPMPMPMFPPPPMAGQIPSMGQPAGQPWAPQAGPQAVQAQSQPKIVLCKYKDKCANQSCPFGHPTPANDDAKVTTMEWCPDKEGCKNASCELAHPSGSLVREPAPLPTEFVLDTCKFLDRCTNPSCRYRHPTSMKPCRNGLACQRLDCTFFHPLKDECKFGVACRNARCIYTHPPDRDEAMSQGFSWVRGQPISERKFAADEPAERMPISS